MKRRFRVLFVLLITILMLFSLVSCGEKVNIKPNEASQIKFTNYKDPDGRFEISIPKGWDVSATVLPDMYFAIHTYKKEDDGSSFHVYMQLKIELMLSEKMKKFEKKNFGRFPQYAMLYDAPVNKDGTVKGTYNGFNDMLDYMVTYEEGYDKFVKPSINDFTVIEEYEYNSLLKDQALDDKIIRATYKENDSLLQGLFTGTVVRGVLGSGTYSVYNVNFISAPEDKFIDYEEVLTEIFNSIKISDDWVNQINRNTEAAYKNAKEIGESLQKTMEECNRAWEKRNSAYDIISQKQSDATLGYERVTDIETGLVYKAYNGFCDEYDGKRYIAITDDMYTLPTSGYIER